jgi:hypothetical protein
MVWTYNESGETYDDTGALYDGLDPALPMTILVGISDDMEDVTPHVKYDTFVATDNGSTGRSDIRFRLTQALSTLPTVLDQAMVRVVNHALNTETHRGFIRSRRPGSEPGGYDYVDIVADDLSTLLDETYIVLESRPAEDMDERIAALWLLYRPAYLDNDLSNVDAIGSQLAAQEFAGVTLRQALEATISQASSSAEYRIDSLGRLHVWTSDSNPAPVNIDVDAPGGGEDAAEELDIEYDSYSFFNQVYVQAATPEASGFYRDQDSIDALGGLVRTSVLQASDVETPAMAAALAAMYLGRVAASTPRGSFQITNVNGWQAGQNLNITDASKGLSATAFRIRRVVTKIVRPGTVNPVFQYTCEFGGSRSGGGFAGGANGSLGAGQLVYGNLGADSNVYITSDGATVTDGQTTRVHLGRLDAITGEMDQFGLYVTGPDGTVIVDGTSNMFKISASGTMSDTCPADTFERTVDITITSLGIVTETPALMAWIATTSGTTAQRRQSPYINSAGSAKFAATSSGGSPTSPSGTWDTMCSMSSRLNSGRVLVRMATSNALPSTSADFFAKFYVMAEAAI